MELDPTYFNMVRTRPQQYAQHDGAAYCQMPGCAARGIYRAPKQHTHSKKPPDKQAHDKKWQYLCHQHIRDYNKAYNFFAGMSEADILAFQKAALIGHRPTWRLGARGPRRFYTDNLNDYFDLFHKNREKHAPRRPSMHRRQKKALEILGLYGSVSLSQIKSKFKALVKRYHPDLNGGDRKYEHRLTKVIQSYNELKTLLK